MARFVMLGKYTQGSMDGISASRTDRAAEVVRESGGEVVGIYALLGAFDLILIVDLPDVETAMQVSLKLTRLTGVGFLTSPAVDVETFDAARFGVTRTPPDPAAPQRQRNAARAARLPPPPSGFGQGGG